MAGFGETVTVVTKKSPKPYKKDEKSDDGFTAIAAERQELKDSPLLSHKWVALWGNEGTGKSGMVQDAYMKDPNRTDKDELWSIDFDDGAATLHNALHGEDRTFVSYHPWVYNTDERTAYDYPETHNIVGLDPENVYICSLIGHYVHLDFIKFQHLAVALLD